MDLDDILSVQTPHFQFLTRPAATPDLLPFQPVDPLPMTWPVSRPKADMNMIIQSISGFTTELIYSDKLDNHAEVNEE